MSQRRLTPGFNAAVAQQAQACVSASNSKRLPEQASSKCVARAQASAKPKLAIIGNSDQFCAERRFDAFARELRATGELSMIVVPQCAFGPGPHGKLF